MTGDDSCLKPAEIAKYKRRNTYDFKDTLAVSALKSTCSTKTSTEISDRIQASLTISNLESLELVAEGFVSFLRPKTTRLQSILSRHCLRKMSTFQPPSIL